MTKTFAAAPRLDGVSTLYKEELAIIYTITDKALLPRLAALRQDTACQ